MYIIRFNKRSFIIGIGLNGVSQVAQVVKNPPANAGAMGDADSILGWEDPLEEEMATHSSILAWRIPWTGEPGRLQSKGSQTVRHNWAIEHKDNAWWPLKVKAWAVQSYPTLCDPMDCSPLDSSVHEILQEFLEWVAIPFTWGSSLSRDQTLVSCIAGRFFTIWACREAL